MNQASIIGRRASCLLIFILGLFGARNSNAQGQLTLLPDSPKPEPGTIVGTVVDINNDAVPGATVTLEGQVDTALGTVLSNDSGFFEFTNIEPGSVYHLTISAPGFAKWTSPPISLRPGQSVIVNSSKLRVATAVTVVTAAYSRVEIATEQVKLQEKQRILGIIPNFYISYDPNAAPLTTKLKFQLAVKVAFDPVTFLGVAIAASAEQAGNHENFPQGWGGYADRYGAAYANGFTDIMVGGAILPSLLHQDPRYFFQGTGTTKSRILHAVSSPFICRGDNGRQQVNYSTIGGDLASAALANAYYPASNRGVGLFLGNFLIATGQRAAANLAQEFILSRVTRRARHPE